MSTGIKLTAEEKRLREDQEKKAYWKKWGPYLSERQWGRCPLPAVGSDDPARHGTRPRRAGLWLDRAGRAGRGLPSVDFSRQVPSARPDGFAVLPVRGVHWNDLGDPERVLSTRRRARTMPMRELIPVSISA